MKYLMVSTYPPEKCGIGTYAYQMVKFLRNGGNVVDVISLEGNGGDFTLNLKGGANLLKILKYAIFYDKVIIQYHESFYYEEYNRKNLFRILCTHLSFYLTFLLLRKKLEVIVHEFPRTHSHSTARFLETIKWRLCPKLVFHTQKEVDDFKQYYFDLTGKNYEIRAPNAYFYKFRDIPQSQARQELGIPSNAVVFLCIGFIQPHKGYDRAVREFQNINNRRMHLYVVGSIRIEWDAYTSYLQELKRMAANNPQIHIEEKFLSDEDFDTWITASDVILIPYREIWSSGVLGRAKLFNKRVIASNVGGLAEQLEDNDILFNTDEELRKIFEAFSKKLSASEVIKTPEIS